MSDTPLQFDRAEYEQPPAAASCARCQQHLSRSYFQVNGHVVCESCARALEAERTGGSRMGRVVRAVGAGFGAAVLGALLYYGISALTGYEFGLIAIVVGFGVGAAVRWGSNGRGGWAYQALAIALTYLAIVSTYVPPIIKSIRELPSQTATADAGVSNVSAETDANAADRTPPSAGRFALAIGLLLVIACAAPFLAGFQNIIGIVIIGIGLYEAWKLNRRTPFDISGPHPVTTAATV